jgi:predicted GNAT superfamily acetyltransferase
MAGRQAPEGMIQVRPLTRHAEFAEAVNLQRIIWKFDELELLPVRLFVTATKVGGQALGAFDGLRMVGFSLAIPGIRAGGKIYLHSHMLGVLEAYRDAGVGRLLKRAQRESALSRGMDTIEWTFDPLEIKNAYFNIERLGAIVRRFALNQYGATSSPLHAGLPTDRCIAEWWIRSARVEATLAGTPIDHSDVTARITVPAAIDSLKRTSPAQAREIQKRVSEEFLEHFAQNLTVMGFERTSEGGTYLLGPWESE